MKPILRLGAGIAVVGTATLSFSAGAQEAGEARAARAEVEEIVVTARRSAESLQTTPVAVTALSGEALAQAQVSTVADLARTTPNLNISTGGGGPASVVMVSIRGQTQGQPSTSADPAVATYIDGVYYARPTGGDLDLFDVRQAEVLRGPQGTLFGRNTTGGAINVTTNDPTDRFEGLVRAGFGNLGQHRAEAMVNVPLEGEQLAVRFVGRYMDDNGFSRFENLGDRHAGDIRSSYFARAKIRIAPTDSPVVVTVAADYARFRSSGQATTTLDVNRNLELAPGFTVGNALDAVGFDPTPYLSTRANFRQNFGYDDTGFGLDAPYDRNNSKGVSVNVAVDVGNVALKSITAYRENFTDNVLDLDGLPINMVSFYSFYDQRQFSQELQLSGTLDKLEWIVGAMFFRETSEEFAQSRSFSFLDPATPVARTTSGDTRNTSVGFFGQLNYHVTDRLRATAGFRYTWDQRQVVRHPIADVATGECAIPAADRDIPGGPCDQSQSVRYNYPAWVFGLDYELSDDVFLYAKTSGAAMAGGWNLRGNFAPSFSPEKVRDVEFGMKADLFDRRLRTNLAVFHTWQNNAQRVVARFDPQFQTSTQYVINAGNARLYGVELEATIIPWEGMTINTNFAYLHSKYKAGSFLEDQTIASAGAVPAGCIAGAAGTIVCSTDRSGEPIPFAPKYNATIGATQEFKLPFGTVSANLNYVYTSAKFAYSATASDQQSQSYKDQVDAANALGRVAGYGLFNGRIAANFDDRWELTVWGRNLANKRYIQNIANYYMAFGAVLGVTAPPRAYGMSASLRW